MPATVFGPLDPPKRPILETIFRGIKTRISRGFHGVSKLVYADIFMVVSGRFRCILRPNTVTGISIIARRKIYVRDGREKSQKKYIRMDQEMMYILYLQCGGRW